MIYQGRGGAELERVVELDRQVQHPDLASVTAVLERARREQADSRRSVTSVEWWVDVHRRAVARGEVGQGEPAVENLLEWP